MLDKPLEAIEKFKEAVEIDPKYAPAYNGWGNALRILKQHEGAIEKFEISIKLDSTRAIPYLNLATELSLENRKEEAREHLLKAREISIKEGNKEVVSFIDDALKDH
jgi:tetratricopeptide (TPR) repeat protein